MSLRCKGLYVVGAKRTPFCKHGGALREVPASHAFAAAAQDAIRSAKVNPALIDNTIVGNVNFLSQCDGGKTPRYCGIYSGVPIDRPALGVNKSCGSGIQAVITGGVDILTGVAKMSLTGGTEIMSTLPHVVRNVRFGTTLGGSYNFEDYLKKEFMDSHCGKSVQRLAEELAKKFGVTRQEADEFTLSSHLKWKAAQEAKVFDDEITTITVTVNKKEILVESDDKPQPNITVEDLAKLPPVLDDGTLISSGNSYSAADGASAVLLANTESVKDHNLTPLARISGWACVGVDPHEFGLGALVATKKLLEDLGLKPSDVDLFEINETFATQAIAMMKQLAIEPERVNVSGGVLSMGHPAAATGARMVTHLVHQLSNRNLKRAIATSSCGGGQGVAIMIENI